MQRGEAEREKERGKVEEKWGDEIKAELLVGAREGGRGRGGAEAGGRGTERVRGEERGWANFINEEMSDEQRKQARPLSA